MLINTSELPELAYCGSTFDKDRFRPIQWESYRPEKPTTGGFWASPVLEDGTTAWEQFLCGDDTLMRRKMRDHGSLNQQSVTPRPGIRVYHVKTESDAHYLKTYYGFDWGKIAENYDAIYVENYWSLREGRWDLPTVLFFNLDAFTVN